MGLTKKGSEKTASEILIKGSTDKIPAAECPKPCKSRASAWIYLMARCFYIAMWNLSLYNLWTYLITSFIVNCLSRDAECFTNGILFILVVIVFFVYM